jgi:hypothetical protein
MGQPYQFDMVATPLNYGRDKHAIHACVILWDHMNAYVEVDEREGTIVLRSVDDDHLEPWKHEAVVHVPRGTAPSAVLNPLVNVLRELGLEVVPTWVDHG